MSSTISSPNSLAPLAILDAFNYLFIPELDFLADILSDAPAYLIDAPAALYVLIND